ncbi:hypothetical protein BS47DRAFT_1265743, partial [Hydnum rufescens UP504]
QEEAVVDWVNHLGLLAQPLDCRTIGPFVKDISGVFPGKNWVSRFLELHKKKIQYCRTAALDPKHAQCFNYATVHDYFNKLKALLDEHGIPLENIYNMDEKGCQM